MTSPALHILGTAQDGGVPQLGCGCPNCERASRDPGMRRLVASVGLTLASDDGEARRWVIDVTPDARAQLPTLASLAAPGHPPRSPGPPRSPQSPPDRPLVDGVFLTHAHIGHYLGLAFLGFEVLNAAAIPVRGTARMLAFLQENAPWSDLVRRQNLMPVPLTPEVAIPVAADVTITPMLVPHRAEHTDTVGYLVDGPRHTIAYVPDTDPWTRWTHPARRRLERADVLIVDATFYCRGELPGRDLTAVGHPFVTDTLDALQPLVDAGRRVVLTHVNHSNPLVDPGSSESRHVRDRGFEVASDGERFDL